jgi:hypothetical protein
MIFRCLHQSSVNSFQRRTFPFLWVPELFQLASTAVFCQFSRNHYLLKKTHSRLNFYSSQEGCLFTSNLCQSQSRPVRLADRHPSGTRDQFFFLLKIFLGQLRVCYFVAPSLMRGRVCNLLLLLVFASAVPLGSESHGTQDHILLSQFLRLPQPGRPGPRIYILQEQGGPGYAVA